MKTKSNTTMRKIFLILVLVAAIAPLSAQRYGFYGRGKSITNNGGNGVYVGYHPAGVSSSHSATLGRTYNNEGSRSLYGGSKSGLGLSSGVMRGGFSGGGSGGSSTPVSFGRTGSTSSIVGVTLSNQGLSLSSRPTSMASTTFDRDGDDPETRTQDFLEPVMDGAPLGDAVLPLLLLIIPIIIVKMKGWKN